MTYCVALSVDEGLVFLSDTRTNAGVDHISTARKMSVFEQPGERVLVLLAAGNLSLTQAVLRELSEPSDPAEPTLWNVPTMPDAARVVGRAVRSVHQREAQALNDFSVEFNCSFILGGQIAQDVEAAGSRTPPPRARLFMIYAAGNFIEASSVNPYFQIGESKYGKPIIDRVLVPQTPLDEAAKCALISMDSTLRSNLSVGLPLDLLVYQKDTLRVTRFVTITQDNAYYQMIHRTWGERLRQVFGEIPDPDWQDAAAIPHADLEDDAVLFRAPASTAHGAVDARPAQTLAQADKPKARR
ncbi:proteasome-type protease [Paraburkholderia rhizosphaerae]|uniref:Putative proteasome-type protease n=1 Tax=Paraburkholderia rhizosphaerae TaxID=480658 RepID=A0A4R8LWP5_9BURK|nr:proteasome-type protease [Paraburkholderia rhizosphaerae]TDY52373.1 putative proteasome-type protease [Paraburkholderia rhizosphaerae]